MPNFVVALNKRVRLEGPSGPSVPDGEGGFTQEYAPLVPARVWAGIQPAAARSLERLVASSVVSQATHLVTIQRHPDVTTSTRVKWDDYGQQREFAVTGVAQHPQDDRYQVLTCEERVT